ncbi:MAG: hypothetical protein JNJ39_06940 [Blastocatellia bacterium]|jgi:hypothetical protein|nr:hypothetical protein [Blastocatellia bacterium]
MSREGRIENMEGGGIGAGIVMYRHRDEGRYRLPSFSAENGLFLVRCGPVLRRVRKGF